MLCQKDHCFCSLYKFNKANFTEKDTEILIFTKLSFCNTLLNTDGFVADNGGVVVFADSINAGTASSNWIHEEEAIMLKRLPTGSFKGEAIHTIFVCDALLFKFWFGVQNRR